VTDEGESKGAAVPPIRTAWTAKPLAVLATLALCIGLFGVIAMASNTEPLGQRSEPRERSIEAIESFNQRLNQQERADIEPEERREAREPIRLPEHLR